MVLLFFYNITTLNERKFLDASMAGGGGVL